MSCSRPFAPRGTAAIYPTEREVRRQTIRALRHQEECRFEPLAARTRSVAQAWPRRLLELAPDSEQTRLEWLWTPRTSKQHSELKQHIAKFKFLRELGADRLKI